jgi:4-amino-4-deoxy-L-arabinose transferase-like glycosyltransferase
MKKFLVQHQYLLIFIIILLVASLIRGYKLSDVPHGMAWDEAAIGYNGYAIFHARRDEWLSRLPVSFGDYKAPFAIYLNGIFTFLFGMNLFAVRLPFFLASIWAIAGMMLLTQAVFKSQKKLILSDRQLMLISGSLMALCPWHIHYSRVAFEAGMALSFLIWGVFSFYRFVGAKTKKMNFFWIISFVFWQVLSIYTYHSAKVVVPLLSLVLVMFYYQELKTKLVSLLTGAILGLGLLFPFIKDSLWGQGATRFSQATIFDPTLSLVENIEVVIIQFFSHFSLNYLIWGQSETLRHAEGKWGIFLITTLVLLILSFLMVFKKNNWRSPVFWLAIGWIIIGIIPAAIGKEVPHSNRSLLSLPGFLLLATWGMDQILAIISTFKIDKLIRGSKNEKNLVVKSVFGCFVLIHLLLFLTYFNHYLSVFAFNSANDFKDGYLEAFTIAKDYEKGENGKPMVDQIVFTTDYGQPYIYALFVRKTNPIWYQGGSLNKYLFKPIDQSDRQKKNVLVVTSGDDDWPVVEANQVVFGSDQQIKFKLYYLPGGGN